MKKFDAHRWIKKLKESRLDIEEGNFKKVTRNMWNRMSDDEKVDALLTVVNDPEEAMKYYDLKWEDLPSGFERDMAMYENRLKEFRPPAIDRTGLDLGPSHTFEPGMKWSNDFDYVGMLKYGAQATLDLGLDILNDLFDSFEDVNYHRESQDLGNAIDWLQDAKGIEDEERAQEFMARFRKKCMATLDVWKVKWRPKQ
jgi:hypothetical protein